MALGIFLVVQWLWLHTFNTGAWLQSLVRELDPTLHNERSQATAPFPHHPHQVQNEGPR